MEIITYILMIAALIGLWYNLNKDVKGFYIWTFSNTGWVVVNIYYGIYAQAILFFIMTLFTIYGIIKWK